MVLNVICPLKKRSEKMKFKNFISKDTKELMRKRDLKKKECNETDDLTKWV